jgi:hypothetical protein
MKKVITYCLFTLCGWVTATAQCPTNISDDAGDGSYYIITLSSLAHCANFPVNGTKTINSKTYDITSCQLDFGIVTAQLFARLGNEVVLATSAPITIPVGASNCMFNSLGNPIALPIELIDFKGISSLSGNVLSWETVREVSSRGFQVERLVGDKTWIPLTFVKSKGAYGKYQFTDANPLATSYYRLRQLDNDGAETFSKIVTVANEKTNGRMSLRIYPNPVSNVLTVETDNATDNFQVINVLGQTILSGKVETYGRMSQRLDVSALAQGTYILKIGTEQVKFVKQ